MSLDYYLDYFAKLLLIFRTFRLLLFPLYFFFTFGSAITITLVLSKPTPTIDKVAAIFEFFGKLVHTFRAVDFNNTFSFFTFFDSKSDNNALGGFLWISLTFFSSF